MLDFANMELQETLKVIFYRLRKFLPVHFFRHYINPLFIRGRKTPYNAKKFFESHHRQELLCDFTDRNTISPDFNPLFARYHYNSVENSIIRYLVTRKMPAAPYILDIGSGAGHWIDFYLEVLRPERIVGMEISEPCTAALRKKYAGKENIDIIEADIASPDLTMKEKFDLINAVGVMFHIVEDELLMQALKNISSRLKENGVVVVSGQFGWITRNTEFYCSSQPESQASAVFYKRIRSLSFWKDCAGQAGLKVERLQRTTQCQDIFTPENNILILTHKS